MHPSVRRRLLVSMAGILILFAATLVAMNSTLLESYYTSMEKRMLKNQAAAIEQIIAGTTDVSELDERFEQLERRHSLTISIIGPDGNPRYFTRMGLLDEPIHLQPSFIPQSTRLQPKSPNLTVLSTEQLQDGSVFELQNDQRLDIKYMTIRKIMDDGSALDIRVMLSSIERGAAIASVFTAYAAALGLLVAAVWAVLFSKRFTEPLVQMSDIAGSIAELDFSRKCKILQKDEIGHLGESINDLSEKLSAALEDLKAKNVLLQEELEHERKLDKMRKEFVANVSHELRTPISIIQGYADGLKMNIAANEERRNYYSDVIINETDRMNRLVGDLLELSQYESGGMKLAKSQFDLVDLIVKITGRCFCEKGGRNGRSGPSESVPRHSPMREHRAGAHQLREQRQEHLKEGGRIRISIGESEDMASWVLRVANDGSRSPDPACLSSGTASIGPTRRGAGERQVRAGPFHSQGHTGHARRRYERLTWMARWSSGRRWESTRRRHSSRFPVIGIVRRPVNKPGRR